MNGSTFFTILVVMAVLSVYLAPMTYAAIAQAFSSGLDGGEFSLCPLKQPSFEPETEQTARTSHFELS